jgi:CBS domain-containing protein
MQCAEIMKTAVESTSPRDTVAHAAACMRDKNIGFLPVCDAMGSVIGTLTDRDIAVRVVASQRPPTTQVGDVMTREIVCCLPEADIQEAERLMAIHQKSRILCVGEDGRPAGVISLSDLAQERPAAAQILRQVSEREAMA